MNTSGPRKSSSAAAGHFNAQNVVHEVVQKGQVKVLPVLHVVDQPQAAAIGRHLDASAPLGGIVVHHAHQQLPVQLAVLTNRRCSIKIVLSGYKIAETNL